MLGHSGTSIDISQGSIKWKGCKNERGYGATSVRPVQAVPATEAASREPSDAGRIVRAWQKGNPVRDAITIRPESRPPESTPALIVSSDSTDFENQRFCDGWLPRRESKFHCMTDCVSRYRAVRFRRTPFTTALMWGTPFTTVMMSVWKPRNLPTSPSVSPGGGRFTSG